MSRVMPSIGAAPLVAALHLLRYYDESAARASTHLLITSEM